MRTQQILAHETGVPEVVDPLAGSWYVEALTDRIEREARVLLEDIEQQGGAARAIERGSFQQAIAQSAYQQQQEVERGERVVVGVNRFDDGSTAATAAQPDYQALAEGQRRRLAESRARRDSAAAKKALGALGAAARGTDALMPRVLDAVRARATLGEIADTLREVWGEYRPG